jgi:hypothetical protein
MLKFCIIIYKKHFMLKKIVLFLILTLVISLNNISLADLKFDEN